MKTLLDAWRAIRLTGGCFLDAQFSAPWCVTAEVESADCYGFKQLPRHVVAYHYVARGHCVLAMDRTAPLEVNRGEVVIVPRNVPHILADSYDPALPVCTLLDLPEGGETRIVYGGGGRRTHVYCGFLGTDDSCSTLIAMLPDVLKLDLGNDPVAAGWVESSCRYAAHTRPAAQSDADCIVVKLAELLLFEAVRRYLILQWQTHAELAVARNDVLIGRALHLLLAQLDRPWTTEALAQAVGLSRSAFAERFARATGEPPMHYLTRLRLGKASGLLRGSAEAISRIAGEVGYSSEASFTRAFRKAYGAPPAAWRLAQSARDGRLIAVSETSEPLPPS